MPLLEGLLKYWPFANRIKETIFLCELTDILEVCDTGMIDHLVPKLFTRVMRCVRSEDIQVADRALHLFEVPKFFQLMRKHRLVTYPIIVPLIRDLGEQHWLDSYKKTFLELRRIVKEGNPRAYYDALGMD